MNGCRRRWRSTHDSLPDHLQEERQGTRGLEFLSSHPAMEKRIEYLQKIEKRKQGLAGRNLWTNAGPVN